jgi:hypothetical protein
LASIVGHASFHTAWRSGPSMIDRSYRAPDAECGGGGRAPSRAGVDRVTADASLTPGSYPCAQPLASAAPMAGVALRRRIVAVAALVTLAAGGGAATDVDATLSPSRSAAAPKTVEV